MIVLRLAYYRRKDWKRFVRMIDDRESMHDTWHDWHEEYERTKRIMKTQGFNVEEVVVDLDELKEYCATQGIKNNGEARSRFVQQK